MNATTPSTHSFRNCTEVSLYCPVEATVLAYYPNLGANAFLAAGFGACILGLAATGIWKKTWGYSGTLLAGSILEFAGYIGRILLHHNPWNSDAFKLQICAIILAPTLICISIYLTLKHVTLSISPALSRVRPRLYPVIFVPADVSCLVLQAIGGGIAASAGHDDPDLLLVGDRVIITGIALQVVVLVVFGAISLDYFWQARRWIAVGKQQQEEEEGMAEARRLWDDGRFRMFCYAVSGAYSGILIRCIYRIAEMAGGWGNPIMQDESSFIVLEGIMILIPAVLLTIFTPGVLFPAMAQRERLRFSKKSKKGESVVTSADEGHDA